MTKPSPLRPATLLLLTLLLGASGCDEPPKDPKPSEPAPRPSLPKGNEGTVFRVGHPRRHEATARARDTVQDFIRALTNPAPAQEKFAIKLATPGQEDEGHYWVTRVRFVGGRFHALVPDKTRPEGVRQEVVAPDRIIDWMYVDNRKLVGNYTFRQVYAGLDPRGRLKVMQGRPFLVEEPVPTPTPATRLLHALGNARLPQVEELVAADPSLVQTLIPAALPDPNGKIRSRRVRPLAYAALWNRPVMVRFLLARGAEVDGRDEGGRTALHHAVEGGLFDMAVLLVKEGADPRAKDHDGVAPIDLARKKFTPAQVARLISSAK